MSRSIRARLAAPALLLLLAGACRGFEADTLFARRLPGPPRERDWADAVPLRVPVSGGAVHQEDRAPAAQEVDQDTVHRNTASCHHGPQARSAFPVWLRAYHDGRNLYLRLTWTDGSRDRETRRWVRRGGSWVLEGGEGDGVSLVFPRTAPGAGFNCSLICHLDDWNLLGGRFQESARMRFRDEGTADLWLWRASDRAARALRIDSRGIHLDSGADGVRVPNSRLAAAGDASRGGTSLVFGAGDEPRGDSAGLPLPPGWRPPEGTEVPAYLPLPDGARGSTIRAGESWRNGQWEITLTRPLATGNAGDLVFAAGGTYLFSLSVLDDTLRNHHIADKSRKLKLLI